jgi:uncharacterized protein YdhG (YjbR/CyaY superfamily)
MAKTDFKTADEYIATFGPEDQAGLEAIRAAIRAGAPEAEEVISYQIPAFKDHGFVFYFSVYAKHYNLALPPPSDLYDVFKAQLAPYELSKSAIKIPKSQPLPLALITEMAAFRVKELRAKPPKKKK